jgi:putative transposase
MCLGQGLILINAFSGWKKSEDAGRAVAVDTNGVAGLVVSGLPWRAEVCQQVFEEAAVDCGRALAAWSDSRAGKRKGKRVGFPRFKKKTGATPSFRLRNKRTMGRRSEIRVGDTNRARSVTLPGIGQIGVHSDTRRLRRMLARDRATILFAIISHRAGRWWVVAECRGRRAAPRPPAPGLRSGKRWRLGRRRPWLVGVRGRCARGRHRGGPRH